MTDAELWDDATITGVATHMVLCPDDEDQEKPTDTEYQFAVAWLRHFRLDGGLPLDPTWLESVGGQWANDEDYLFKASERQVVGLYREGDCYRVRIYPHAGSRDWFEVAPVKTRGEARRLFEVIGIRLERDDK
jgi:hypothetical protein